jgi:hypothetical protein
MTYQDDVNVITPEKMGTSQEDMDTLFSLLTKIHNDISKGNSTNITSYNYLRDSFYFCADELVQEDNEGLAKFFRELAI